MTTTLSALLEPSQREINGKSFTLSKFPATVAREIICKYPLSAMPKIGDYPANHETMLKLMRYVAVEIAGSEPLRLTTEELVNNHVYQVGVSSGETLLKLEWAMLEYNFDFFAHGLSSSFLEAIKAKALPLATKIWTDLSAQLSATGKRPSKS